MYIAMFLICLALLLFGVYVIVTLARIERDITRERDERRELRDEFSKHYWDAQAAFRVLGLTKTPQRHPEWTKD